MNDNMYYGAGPLIFDRARELRNTMTSAERIIWNHLHINEWKLKFRRQHPISNFIADFYCHTLKLVIEIDGDIHDQEDVKKLDLDREKILKSLGLTIVRFKNEEVFKESNLVLRKIDETIRLLQSSPLGDGGQIPPLGDGGDGGQLYIIKIGGNIIDDDAKLNSFLSQFSIISGKKILVHGGGKMATRMAEQLNLPQNMVEGRRVTDSNTLRIVTMVYAGYINKNIVAKLQSSGCNAIGLCGADGNAVMAHKRIHATTDYGFAGDVDKIDASFFSNLLQQGLHPVVAPITHDRKGQLLNTNADTIAQEIAKGMSHHYEVQLIYTFEKNGVLLDATDDNTVIPEMNRNTYNEMKEKKQVFEGMIPKLDNAFSALSSGVNRICIGKAEDIHQLINGEKGTTIING